MAGRKILSSGAESLIYLNSENNIEKDRVEKKYRIKEIDDQLRISRTRREAKILLKLLKLGLDVPKVIKQSATDIEMEYIDGVQLKKILDERPGLAELIGKTLTILHDNDIIHGDLTTSNMILKILHEKDKKGKKSGSERLYFIDFGLSYSSTRIEDKAVDIHLFKQALESKHFRSFDAAYKNFLKGYEPKDKKLIMARLLQVEQRGRYKEKT